MYCAWVWSGVDTFTDMLSDGNKLIQKLCSGPYGVVRYRIVAHVQRNQRKNRTVYGIASGVVIKVLNKTAAPEKQDFENEKLAKMQESMRNYSYRMNNAVKKNIKMDDRRAKFF